MRTAHVKHGATWRRGQHAGATAEYRVWHAIKNRCFNPKASFYRRYGGRGITMCDRWRDSFAAFLEDMGPRPAWMSIDRIDNDGDYEPGNCRWTTQKEQARALRGISPNPRAKKHRTHPHHAA